MAIPYSQIRDVDIGRTHLGFIDDIFGVCDVVIRWERPFRISAVRDGRKVVEELNERIAAPDKKKATVDDLLSEIQHLKSEVAALKSRKEEPKEKAIGPANEERKKGFRVKPL